MSLAEQARRRPTPCGSGSSAHLKVAIDLATRVGPGTLGHSRAWSPADGVTVAETLGATAARLRRR